MHELSVRCLLCDDDQVILAPSACGLQEMSDSTTECDILIEGEKVEQVKDFVYLEKEFVYLGSESWVCQKKNESRVNEVEIWSIICGVSRKNRRRNSNVRERCYLKGDVVTRVERATSISHGRYLHYAYYPLSPLSIDAGFRRGRADLSGGPAGRGT
ncbi:hypothetical protein EVAR_17157_1 [Eumeta japonica]|uniref:Uncharacterized protein n=1 Tax=Eumeta variegata TaxID=151549 RepID=A0A4C1UM01_EUMVA|nr:hypothetical protein EVAR_17157_1 [Eumeta japonica]